MDKTDETDKTDRAGELGKINTGTSEMERRNVIFVKCVSNLHLKYPGGVVWSLYIEELLHELPLVHVEQVSALRVDKLKEYLGGCILSIINKSDIWDVLREYTTEYLETIKTEGV